MSLDSKVTQIGQKHTQTKSANYRIPSEKTIRPLFVKWQLQATLARPNRPQLHTGQKQAKANWPKPTYRHIQHTIQTGQNRTAFQISIGLHPGRKAFRPSVAK
ncbi:hypothetical protein Nepgr_028304 [Nepenthes gracilis]|uniref:Uncharacterized protein n=1 Tax=Nepenthes gracilis TaxID=150966 RepID=A0AAD3Y4E1_NEPGR|nr:hypothetical protein Nepgr_028304 [Nepenthes gracilis]